MFMTIVVTEEIKMKTYSGDDDDELKKAEVLSEPGLDCWSSGGVLFHKAAASGLNFVKTLGSQFPQNVSRLRG